MSAGIRTRFTPGISIHMFSPPAVRTPAPRERTKVKNVIIIGANGRSGRETVPLLEAKEDVSLALFARHLPAR